MASVARNPNITWFLFSNDDSLAKHPANLVVHKMSLREFNALCEEKLGFDPASFMTAAVSSVTGTRVAKKFPVRTL